MPIEFIKSLIFAIIDALPNNDTGKKIRYMYYKKRLRYLGDNVKLGPYFQILSPERLSIGNGSAINKNCYINAFNSVDIGENCLIGPNCVISSTNHSFKKNNLII